MCSLHFAFDGPPSPFLHKQVVAVSPRLVVGISLLQGLFVDAISGGGSGIGGGIDPSRLVATAARVIRLLERVALEVDHPSIVTASDSTIAASSDGTKVADTSSAHDIQALRVSLARKWAAQLVGSSLYRIKNNVASSVKRVVTSKAQQIIE